MCVEESKNITLIVLRAYVTTVMESRIIVWIDRSGCPQFQDR